jgi:hypothetical protein
MCWVFQNAHAAKMIILNFFRILKDLVRQNYSCLGFIQTLPED